MSLKIPGWLRTAGAVLMTLDRWTSGSSSFADPGESPHVRRRPTPRSAFSQDPLDEIRYGHRVNLMSVFSEGPQPTRSSPPASEFCCVYTVIWGPLVKFGIGNENRVPDHVARGARVQKVFRGTREECIAVENRIKARYKGRTVADRYPDPRAAFPGAPSSFGAFTEVMEDKRVRLGRLFRGGEDVTGRFGRAPSSAAGM